MKPFKWLYLGEFFCMPTVAFRSQLWWSWSGVGQAGGQDPARPDLLLALHECGLLRDRRDAVGTQRQGRVAARARDRVALASFLVEVLAARPYDHLLDRAVPPQGAVGRRGRGRLGRHPRHVRLHGKGRAGALLAALANHADCHGGDSREQRNPCAPEPSCRRGLSGRGGDRRANASGSLRRARGTDRGTTFWIEEWLLYLQETENL